MSIGLLTSTIQVLKRVTDQAQPYVISFGEGLTTMMDAGSEKNFKHLATKKSRWQLMRLSAAVCGIELCYAAETAFVSPILLKLGVPISLMTLVWCVSPLMGFILVPLLGSLSDRCRLQYGRRRPFILLLSAGIILGLILVPNGETLGEYIGDNDSHHVNRTTLNTSLYDAFNDTNLSDTQTEQPINSTLDSEWHIPKIPDNHVSGIVLTIFGVALLDFSSDAAQSPCRAYLLDISISADHSTGLTSFTVLAGLGGSIGYIMGGIDWNKTNFGKSFGGHTRVVFTLVLIAYIFCVLITVTSFKEVPLDELRGGKAEQMQRKKKKKGKSKYKKFVNEDTSSSESEDEYRSNSQTLKQSTSASYGTLDESITGSRSTKTSSSIDQSVSRMKSGKNREPFESSSTENSTGRCKNTFGESIQGSRLGKSRKSTNEDEAREILKQSINKKSSRKYSLEDELIVQNGGARRISDDTGLENDKTVTVTSNPEASVNNIVTYSTEVTLKTYLLSIIHMPRSIAILCLTNLFCWMSLVCYSLYFTDFVGQAIFEGDPQAPMGSVKHELYDEGVRLGSFGMSLYSLSCAMYSLCIEKLVDKFKAKKIYIGGQLVYTCGMIIMALTRHRIAAVLLSPSAGIMYATLFTMPYLLLANYHTKSQFSTNPADKTVRGLGTDVAVVSSMVFLAQFILSAFVGTIIDAVGSSVAIVVAAAIFSFIGACCATQVMYLDL
ncbi:Proton-associated sugar transporter A [Mizuhopecten yessoensis]|uniref:Proton-associated sugar transporter A n=1 Tax=Mizuhopecten yessoensis TaxID=6573 RepID=A0A210QU72_MIZYE|nr:Proton-associated sugar transporter A [Mizuhopecten yessoensis]